MSMISTSPLSLIRPGLSRRVQRLKCRFVIWSGPCHRRVSDLTMLCRHLESAAYETGCSFLEAMERQGWESADGRLKITGGPWPATPVGTSDLVRPGRPVSSRGLHPRFSPGATYDSPIVRGDTLDTTDRWEYELSGRFVRPLPPLELPVSTLEAVLRQQRSPRGRESR